MKISKEDGNQITNDKAKLVGQGPWIKDSAYWVYDLGADRNPDVRFVAVMVIGNMNCDLEFDYSEYIKEEEIGKYV